MMHRLFWGLFFVLLDFEVTVGRAVFEILPDFVGYFLLMKGMEELANSVSRFEKSRHVAFGLFLAGVIGYGAGLLNLETMAKVWLWVLETGCLGVFLWLLKQIVADRNEQTRGLYLIVAVMQVLSHLLGWIPFVGSVCKAASLVTAMVFLLAYWKEMKKTAA